ncbi:Hypothetical protein LBF_1061 [Leptospira biflexa serovar Patoc strain 'Patoc 1 (Ames)']|uniref:Uncharacterized protein n=1 Tax=Leptospira biflexa serovar Patoc (strain Patoc 1 / ATCC 23582 / Paris) TaxID=456481 RepID=B0SN34_LEPBP|nr:hypothetical protein [Leptospira biflexa]ABZ93587.1 Hypothetical protein LBF_1061 [Leptospira biflexa serovar Patoc strain 'Patoc 1 (Ames)']ABZ97221.1 Hypothetical protein; putative signal peptide [Leptospira biflexa serovar Patoc strain 'Patoc 1 (Paris)']
MKRPAIPFRMVLLLFIILIVCWSCIGRQTNHNYETLSEPARPHRFSNVSFANKYGYNSECLVLMEGPLPSRLEPCVVGDIRSATMMYKETEVTVSGDTAQFEWQMTGIVYSPFVNETYYQNFILYRGSFFRKLSYKDYRPVRNEYGPPYFRTPSSGFRNPGYYRYGR